MTDRPAHGFERRMVHRLLRLWRQAQPEGALPSLEAVYDQGLDDIVPDSFVLRVPEGGGEPEFGRIGESFATVGAGLTGKPVSAAPAGTLLAVACGFHADVRKRKVPITMGDSFVDAEGRTVLYRSIILPTSADGRAVNYLLCAANSKVREDDGASA